MSIMLIAITLTQLGTPVGYVYFLARYRGLQRDDLLRPALASGAMPVAVVAVVAAGAGIVFRVPLARALVGPDVAEGPGIVALLAGVLLVGVCAEGSRAATRGVGPVRPPVVADQLRNPTRPPPA